MCMHKVSLTRVLHLASLAKLDTNSLCDSHTCVCVCERERECVHMSVCVCVCVCV